MFYKTFERSDTVTGQLDYFNVLLSHGTLWNTCSEFSGLGIVSESGMRVNCEPLKGNHNRALIQSRSNKGLSICEIEVHTLGNHCNIKSTNTISFHQLFYFS